MKIRRALFSTSDKAGIVALAKALADQGAEIVATGRTAQVLSEGGLTVVPIEEVTGSPEAFQGRMKTLSFAVCSGILFRRGNAKDEKDLAALKIHPIDCVVVNFYPFEAAVAKGLGREKLIEEIDIGGPTLVRAAAKNSPDVLVLTDPSQYPRAIEQAKTGSVDSDFARQCAGVAWQKVLAYDTAIAEVFGTSRTLRYGENPHQDGRLMIRPQSPIRWPINQNEQLTPNELSYNNVLDVSAAYGLARDLKGLYSDRTSVVVVKHNNPCGVAAVTKNTPDAQLKALREAWAGDPISAFGGVLVFTDPLERATLSWLSEKFVELIAAPSLAKADLDEILKKRKKLKACQIADFQGVDKMTTTVPGGMLVQTVDGQLPQEELEVRTRVPWPEDKRQLTYFGIAIGRALKSNAIALVRQTKDGTFQLAGAGQGQPNRVDALNVLAVPRARSVVGGDLGECVMVSDAFFPFRDTVDHAAKAGVKYIVQPGGSIKDQDSVQACDEAGISMAFTGRRHFKH